MKKIKSLLILLLITTSFTILNAQPLPNHGNDPTTSGNDPVGGGAPIGSGLAVLLGLGVFYGSYRVWSGRKKLEE